MAGREQLHADVTLARPVSWRLLILFLGSSAALLLLYFAAATVSMARQVPVRLEGRGDLLSATFRSEEAGNLRPGQSLPVTEGETIMQARIVNVTASNHGALVRILLPRAPGLAEGTPAIVHLPARRIGLARWLISGPSPGMAP
jgi:hypothetical protein